jgi:hypothetical protein
MWRDLMACVFWMISLTNVGCQYSANALPAFVFYSRGDATEIRGAKKSWIVVLKSLALSGF